MLVFRLLDFLSVGVSCLAKAVNNIVVANRNAWMAVGFGVVKNVCGVIVLLLTRLL